VLLVRLHAASERAGQAGAPRLLAAAPRRHSLHSHAPRTRRAELPRDAIMQPLNRMSTHAFGPGSGRHATRSSRPDDGRTSPCLGGLLAQEARTVGTMAATWGSPAAVAPPEPSRRRRCPPNRLHTRDAAPKPRPGLPCPLVRQMPVRHSVEHLWCTHKLDAHRTISIPAHTHTLDPKATAADPVD
jgi:hypothetical protein